MVLFGCTSGASERVTNLVQLYGWLEFSRGVLTDGEKAVDDFGEAMRERSAGTTMAMGGTRSGGSSLVMKRTRTWREGRRPWLRQRMGGRR